MAEGILNQSAGDLYNIRSAGSKPAGYVHPLAIEVMHEIGIDLTAHHSKHLNQFLDQTIATVITVCDHAKESCPIFPGQVQTHHWSFPDPPEAALPGEQPIDAFRRIRDEIQKVFLAYAAGLRFHTSH